MAEYILNIQLGENASAHMTFDDSTMKLVEIGANNQTGKRIIIKVSGAKNWIITIPSWTERSQQIIALQQPTFEWREWYDEGGTLRRVPAGFFSHWILSR